MKKFISKVKKLPVDTKQLLALGIIFAFTIALPLFVWAIITQRFELREKAATGETVPRPTATACTATATPNPCTGQSNGTNCIGGGCGPCVDTCTRPIFFGTCQNGSCVPPAATASPTATATPNPCEGKSDGTSCTVQECPPPCTPSIINGLEVTCPLRPCIAGPGTCQNGDCVTSSPTCPDGDKGNLDCDTNGRINSTDLSILLSSWCTTNNCLNVIRGKRSPDLNGDGKVNSTDLSVLLSNWKTN